MPRQARRISATSTYHIMLRGNERKNIFKDNEDKLCFLHALRNKNLNNTFKLYAYCIMNNHAHLLIKENGGSISEIIKNAASRYAYYYNKKYKRVGHVFQDRFKSECINNEAYLLNVIRYIHNNPEKAGICSAAEYKWSSQENYLNSENQPSEVKEILSIFSSDIKTGVRLFHEFTRQNSNDSFVDMEDDQDAINAVNAADYFEKLLQKNKIHKADLKLKEHLEKRRTIIEALAELPSLSTRKIADVTGLSRETVRIILSAEPSP